MVKQLSGLLVLVLLMAGACKKNHTAPLRYFEVGLDNMSADWRDTAFVVAISNAQLLQQIDAQLQLPVDQRTKIVNGKLEPGSGGYNKNAAHEFVWHFNENDWQLTDFSIELSDGRPYSDVDLHNDYWMESVKRFSPWSSYIKKEVYPSGD